MISIRQWITNHFGGNNVEVKMTSEKLVSQLEQVSLKGIAFWGIVNKIANVISKCEFRTYINNKEVKGNEYYLWNYNPNPNQNSNEFIKQLISQLYQYNECLIFEKNNQLFVADNTYTHNKNGFSEDTFEDIEVNSTPLGKTLRRNEVIFIKLNNDDVRKLVDGLSMSYLSLIDTAINSYGKNRGRKGILNIDASATSNPDFEERVSNLLNNDFKKFFESDNAVLPLFQGFDYQDIESKIYAGDNTRDVKNLCDDIFDFTARAFSFPPSLAKGDVQDTEKAVEEMLTFCIEPLIELIQTEINRARNGKSVLKGTYIKIDYKSIKHRDLLDAATQIDKLIASGVASINDILRLFGEPNLAEEWADKHYITKNYSNIEEELKEGGE